MIESKPSSYLVLLLAFAVGIILPHSSAAQEFYESNLILEINLPLDSITLTTYINSVHFFETLDIIWSRSLSHGGDSFLNLPGMNGYVNLISCWECSSFEIDVESSVVLVPGMIIDFKGVPVKIDTSHKDFISLPSLEFFSYFTLITDISPCLSGYEINSLDLYLCENMKDDSIFKRMCENVSNEDCFLQDVNCGIDISYTCEISLTISGVNTATGMSLISDETYFLGSLETSSNSITLLEFNTGGTISSNSNPKGIIAPSFFVTITGSITLEETTMDIVDLIEITSGDLEFTNIDITATTVRIDSSKVTFSGTTITADTINITSTTFVNIESSVLNAQNVFIEALEYINIVGPINFSGDTFTLRPDEYLSLENLSLDFNKYDFYSSTGNITLNEFTISEANECIFISAISDIELNHVDLKCALLTIDAYLQSTLNNVTIIEVSNSNSTINGEDGVLINSSQGTFHKSNIMGNESLVGVEIIASDFVFKNTSTITGQSMGTGIRVIDSKLTSVTTNDLLLDGFGHIGVHLKTDIGECETNGIVINGNANNCTNCTAILIQGVNSTNCELEGFLDPLNSYEDLFCINFISGSINTFITTQFTCINSITALASSSGNSLTGFSAFDVNTLNMNNCVITVNLSSTDSSSIKGCKLLNTVSKYEWDNVNIESTTNNIDDSVSFILEMSDSSIITNSEFRGNVTATNIINSMHIFNGSFEMDNVTIIANAIGNCRNGFICSGILLENLNDAIINSTSIYGVHTDSDSTETVGILVKDSVLRSGSNNVFLTGESSNIGVRFNNSDIFNGMDITGNGKVGIEMNESDLFVDVENNQLFLLGNAVGAGTNGISLDSDIQISNQGEIVLQANADKIITCTSLSLSISGSITFKSPTHSSEGIEITINNPASSIILFEEIVTGPRLTVTNDFNSLITFQEGITTTGKIDIETSTELCGEMNADGITLQNLNLDCTESTSNTVTVHSDSDISIVDVSGGEILSISGPNIISINNVRYFYQNMKHDLTFYTGRRT